MIANVSHCFAAEIEALRLALRHKEALEHLGTIQDAITLKHGLSFGAVWTVCHVVHRVGIEPALKLFAQRTKTKPVSLFLYDATSRMENRLHVRLDQQWPIPTFGSGFSEGDRNKAVAQTFTVGASGVLAYVEMVLSEQTGDSSAGMVVDLRPVVNGAPGADDSALTRLTIPNGLLAEPNTHEGFAIPFLSPPIAVKRGQKLAVVLRALPGGFYGGLG